MGLYINKHEHPQLFKNDKNLKEHNQNFIKKGSISELLDEHHKANVSIFKAVDEMRTRFHQHSDVEAEMVRWLQSIDEKNNRLEEANHQLTSQINELQKKLTENFSKQETFQTGVLSRLDSQEALTEKISRQLNHMRSILFERTNYLASKIDEGYKITSSYVYNLMTGSDQPITFYLMNKKKETEQK